MHFFKKLQVYTVTKHLAHEICQRKFGHVKMAIKDVLLDDDLEIKIVTYSGD